MVFFGPANVLGLSIDILVRITCMFSPVVGKVSHSPKWRMIYGQLGRNDQVVGIGLFARIGPVVCLT